MGCWIRGGFANDVDGDLVPDRLVDAVNLLFQPETSRLRTTGM